MCFKFPVLLLRMLCGCFAHQIIIVFEGSSAGPVQTYTAILPGSRLSVVSLRLVVQDAMRHVFDVYPEARIKVYVADRQFNVQSEKQKTQRKARGRVLYELKKQIFELEKLDFVIKNEQGKEEKSKMQCSSKWMMNDMNEFCEKEGPGQTCSAEYSGDGVRVIDCKKKGKKTEDRQRNTGQIIETTQHNLNTATTRNGIDQSSWKQRVLNNSRDTTAVAEASGGKLAGGSCTGCGDMVLICRRANFLPARYRSSRKISLTQCVEVCESTAKQSRTQPLRVSALQESAEVESCTVPYVALF